MEEKLLRILGHFLGGNLEILSMKNCHEKIALKKMGSEKMDPKLSTQKTGSCTNCTKLHQIGEVFGGPISIGLDVMKPSLNGQMKKAATLVG